jgi:hypothetical protein
MSDSPTVPLVAQIRVRKISFRGTDRGKGEKKGERRGKEREKKGKKGRGKGKGFGALKLGVLLKILLT